MSHPSFLKPALEYELEGLNVEHLEEYSIVECKACVAIYIQILIICVLGL